MEFDKVLAIVLSFVGGFLVLKWFLKSINCWLYEFPLGYIRYALPPGDLGWPFIGNMLSFIKAFKSSNPDTFMSSFVTRYGRTGIYKAFMFGKPGVIVTTPEACKRVLTDDDTFRLGWPITTVKLIGEKSFLANEEHLSNEEHKRLRRLTAASLNGQEALSMYMPYIVDTVLIALEKWSSMGQLEFATELRKMTFRIIILIFLGPMSDQAIDALEKEYSVINRGVFALAINLPGFAYHKAIKARKKLVSIFQSIIDDRRQIRKRNGPKKKDMLDELIDAEDENGRKLDDQELIDVLLMYLNAGLEASAHTTMWATIFLQENPEVFQKAKAEQEEIVKKRPGSQTRLTVKEVRQMEYLTKVIDETLRVVTVSPFNFREAKSDVNINGYTVPKGWKVLIWYRTVHLDPDIYPEPKKFEPSKWDDYIPKPGTFLPFGAGSRLCPGRDLNKMEVATFLHYFLLYYGLERTNPGCEDSYLPHRRPKDNCLARIRKQRTSPN